MDLININQNKLKMYQQLIAHITEQVSTQGLQAVEKHTLKHLITKMKCQVLYVDLILKENNMFNIIEETTKEYKDYFYTIDTYPQMYEVNVWSYTDDDFHYKSKFIYDDLEDVIYSIEYYLDEHDRKGE